MSLYIYIYIYVRVGVSGSVAGGKIKIVDSMTGEIHDTNPRYGSPSFLNAFYNRKHHHHHSATRDRSFLGLITAQQAAVGAIASLSLKL